MKRLHKILFAFTCLALLLLVGYFAFGTPGLAHAQDLHTDLVNGKSTQTWIFDIWKVTLALANVIVIVMLLFVAIVNIVHLQYDTYAIKKSLPLLIIGVIMANFSLLICRMIVDAAQVLTNTFAGDPRALAEGLLCSMGFVTNHSSISVVLLTATGLSGIAIILMIILMLVILIAVVILAFLLWMRKFVIFLLVAVAPIAFIMYAFPPTQNLFKKWWSWFLTWTFMGPLVMLLVWAASKIGATNCTAIGGHGNFNISALFATVGVIYLAAIVPFKLGGPVMGAWGKAGQWLTGSGKTGWARKPIDAGIQKQKDLAKGAASNRFYSGTGLGRHLASRSAGIDELLKTQKEEAEGIKADARQHIDPRTRGLLEKRQREAANSKENDEASVQENLNRMEKGDVLEGLTQADYMAHNGETAMAAANRYVSTKSRINVAKKSVIKRQALDVFYKSKANMSADKDVREAQKKALQDTIDNNTYRNGVDGITSNLYDSTGQLRGTENTTYAKLIDSAADFTAKGKVQPTNSVAQRKFFDIAREKELEAARYRENNINKYDYEAVLDRNISGRQHAEMKPFIKDEINTEYLNNTGFTIGDGTRRDPNGNISSFGTAEIRGTNEDMDRGYRGEWDKNEGLANTAVVIKRDAWLQHSMEGVRNGDRGGVYAFDDFLNRVQEARTNMVDAQGNAILDHNNLDARNTKFNTFSTAFGRLRDDDQRKLIASEILRQYNVRNSKNQVADFQQLQADTTRWQEALSNFEVKDLTPGRGRIGIAHQQFLQSSIGEIVHDKFLKIGQSSELATASPPGGDPHPLTNPRPLPNSASPAAPSGGGNTGGGGNAGSPNSGGSGPTNSGTPSPATPIGNNSSNSTPSPTPSPTPVPTGGGSTPVTSAGGGSNQGTDTQNTNNSNQQQQPGIGRLQGTIRFNGQAISVQAKIIFGAPRSPQFQATARGSSYVIANIPAGSYNLPVTVIGLQETRTIQHQQFQIISGQATRLNLIF